MSPDEEVGEDTGTDASRCSIALECLAGEEEG